MLSNSPTEENMYAAHHNIHIILLFISSIEVKTDEYIFVYHYISGDMVVLLLEVYFIYKPSLYNSHSQHNPHTLLYCTQVVRLSWCVCELGGSLIKYERLTW